MRTVLFVVLCLSMATHSIVTGASGTSDGYRIPPQAIVDVLDAPPLPMVSVSPTRDALLFAQRIALPPIGDLAQPMLRLAGQRINPLTHGEHGPRRIVALALQRMGEGREIPLELPADSNLGMPRWAPDGKHFAFTRTVANGIELWVGETATASVRKLLGPELNETLDSGFWWLPGSNALLCRVVPAGRAAVPVRGDVPKGPAIQSTSGRSGSVRTYQDLLADSKDAELFEHYMTCEIVRLELDDGARTRVLEPAVYTSVRPSPGGKHLLSRRAEKPYSFLVPAFLFPTVVEVREVSGKLVRELVRKGVRDDIPSDGVETGPRSFDWQGNAAEVLVYAEALDGGNPRNKVAHRDQLFTLAAPFDQPAAWMKTEYRFTGIQWAETTPCGILGEYERDRRWQRTSWVDASVAGGAARVLWERNRGDVYSDPGLPLSVTMPSGQSLVMVENGALYLSGRGATPDGDRPFLDRMNLDSGTKERLFRCEGECLESVVDVLDRGAQSLLTRHETRDTPPNYRVRALESKELQAVTRFTDPSPALRKVRKELVKYQRDDGVELSATLYVPAERKDGERLPLLVWAYPMEFSDSSVAGQVSGSPFRFDAIGGASHLFLLLQGYAIMDGATIPVIGDPEHCNDTFVEQIVASAKAAIDHAVALGVADRDRVAVGGHSYGAFMTANLLAHSSLFRAGVARSGAYNRTLTPFGFQSEPRNLWEAPDVYVRLSPFLYAHQIDEPLLLIHGELDNNQGTFPIQTERLFQAIQGNGGNARMVMLPLESHGYQARESVLHTLAEMVDWLDQHVKNATDPAQ